MCKECTAFLRVWEAQESTLMAVPPLRSELHLGQAASALGLRLLKQEPGRQRQGEQ